MRRLCAPFALLVLTGLFLTGLLACDDSPSGPTGSIPFTTLAEAGVAGSAGPQIQTIVRSEAAWSQLWSDLWVGQEPARPPVDFTRDMVVLVTASQTCAGGAEVEEIQHTGSEIVVRYGDAAPSLCLCVISTLNFHAVRAPALLGDARFEARQTPPLCG